MAQTVVVHLQQMWTSVVSQVSVKRWKWL